MTTSRWILRATATAVVGLLFLGAGPAQAVDAVVKCELVKLKVAGKAARSLARCQAKAAATGLTVDAGCLAVADARLVDGFAKADVAGGCGFLNATALVQGLLGSATDALVALLRPLPTPSQCSSYKLRAAGQFVFDLLLAQSRYAKTSNGVFLAQGIGRAHATIAGAFAVADAHYPCFTLGDVGPTVDAVQALVADVLEVVASASRPLAGVDILYFNESATGDLSGVEGAASGTPYLELGIFLRALGATIHLVASPATFPFTPAALAPYDLVVIGLTTRVWEPAELAALGDFVSAGGGLLSIDGFNVGDLTEVASRNQLLAPFGMIHVLPDLTTAGTDLVAHPVTSGVTELRGIGGRALVTALPAQPLISHGSTELLACLVNVGVGEGRVCALFDEWLWLHDSGDVGWDNPSHQALAANLFFWLTKRAP